MCTSKASFSGHAIMFGHTLMDYFLRVKPGEQVLILADTETEAEYIHAYASVANVLGAEPTIAIMPPSHMQLERELTRVALKCIESTDIYLPMTSTTWHSIHTEKVSKAIYEDKTMRMFRPPLNKAQMEVALEAIRNHNHELIFATNEKIAEILNRGKNVHITCELGTDFKASISNIPFRTVSALVREPGQLGALPDGEVYGGPEEGTGEGVIVIDGPIYRICEKPDGPSEPILLEIKKGKVVKVGGGEEAKRISEMIASVKNMDNIAEIAIGTNPFLRPTGNIWANDKKIRGTMHTALGHNTFEMYPKGTVECEIHMDCLLRKPTLKVDGETIVENGEIVIQR